MVMLYSWELGKVTVGLALHWPCVLSDSFAYEIKT